MSLNGSVYTCYDLLAVCSITGMQRSSLPSSSYLNSGKDIRQRIDDGSFGRRPIFHHHRSRFVANLTECRWEQSARVIFLSSHSASQRGGPPVGGLVDHRSNITERKDVDNCLFQKNVCLWLVFESSSARKRSGHQHLDLVCRAFEMMRK